MKILHLNYSDQIGGAAVSVMRLHKSLLKKKIKSNLLVSEKTTNEINVLCESTTLSKMYDLFKMKNVIKARVALTSGYLEYVPDKINEFDLHSAFAQTLIDVLTDNFQPMLSIELFVKLQQKLYDHNTDQVPVFGGIVSKSHSVGGEFIFVPVK